MNQCRFCERAAVQRVWLRRRAAGEGGWGGGATRDVRVDLCGRHVGRCVVRGEEQRVGGWVYG